MYRLKITESDFDTIVAALCKVFIIKSFAVSNAISFFIANQHWNKYHINISSINNDTVYGFMYIVLLQFKRRICIHFNGLHFMLVKIRLRVSHFQRRISELEKAGKQMRI